MGSNPREGMNVCKFIVPMWHGGTLTSHRAANPLVSSKNIIDADSVDENEMNIVDPVPTFSEMRNIMKSTRSYLDAHSNSEMNNKMGNVEQFDAKKDNAKKISD
ncbi:hypothetical protein TNCV_2136481 [Trichonephila clavipes]|nr:hypothetical protein TNCV_2136481 [Trichonephila clavipes]